MTDPGEIIQDAIDGIEAVKPFLANVPPPAGPLLLLGAELAEAIAGFIPSEHQRKVTDRLLLLIKGGIKADVEGDFRDAFPNG